MPPHIHGQNINTTHVENNLVLMKARNEQRQQSGFLQMLQEGMQALNPMNAIKAIFGMLGAKSG